MWTPRKMEIFTTDRKDLLLHQANSIRAFKICSLESMG